MLKKYIPVLIIVILGVLDFAVIGFAWQNPTQAPPGGNLTLPWIKSGTNVYLSNSSDNVGIGTTAPIAKLTVATSGDNIGAIIGYTGTGSFGMQLGYYQDSHYGMIQILDGTGWKNLALNPSGGNVGIGTTTPAQKLEVVGFIQSTYDSGNILIGTPSTFPGFVGRFNDGGVLQRRDIRFDATGISLLTANGDNIPSATNGIIINESGYVGIGTTNPQMKLEINGVKDDNSSRLRFVGSDVEAGWIGTDSTPALVIRSTFSDLRTRSLGNTWMRSAENFYFDLDSDANGTNYFYIRDDSLAIVFNVAETGYVGMGVTGQTYRLQLPNTANNGGKGQANAWVTYSDIRYKTNIRPITNALDKINKLEGVYFNWKSDNSQSIGLIAQDVEPIIPEVVTTDSEGYKSLDYAKLTSLLIQGIKEQQTQIESLKQQITELKAQANNTQQ